MVIACLGAQVRNGKGEFILSQRKKNASSLAAGPSGKLGIEDLSPFLQNTEILGGQSEGGQSLCNPSLPQR